jgi:hypothetical protein
MILYEKILLLILLKMFVLLSIHKNMIKQIKLLTILGSAAILGGVSTFAILGTSCGNGGGSTSGSIVILPPSLEVGQIIMSTVLVSTTPFDHNLSSEISGEYITFEDGAFFEV